MRASRMKGKQEDHISGAETLLAKDRIMRQMTQYLQRAMDHPRGVPDTVTLTIERLDRRVRRITSLPVSTLRCTTSAEAETAAAELLRSCGVSDAAIRSGMRILRKSSPLRGAALLDMRSGARLDTDHSHGVRVSRLGISEDASKSLSRSLSRHGINTTTVKEALVLASKVASCMSVVAELCISDDPGYTTGYCSSRRWGYVRIPNIKAKDDRRGGRLFFVCSGTNPSPVIHYLQRAPVLVNRITSTTGTINLDELIRHRHR